MSAGCSVCQGLFCCFEPTLLFYVVEELGLCFLPLFLWSISGNESVVLQVEISNSLTRMKQCRQDTYSNLKIRYFCEMVIVCRHAESCACVGTQSVCAGPLKAELNWTRVGCRRHIRERSHVNDLNLTSPLDS